MSQNKFEPLIEFNQWDLCTFTTYIPALRNSLNHLKEGSEDWDILQTWFKKAREEKGKHKLPVMPIFFSVNDNGLSYGSCSAEGDMNFGFIKNDKLGFEINRTNENATLDCLENNLDKILEITCMLGHTSETGGDLLKYYFKFNGLCELICNYVVMNNLMGKASGNGLKNYKKDSFTMIQKNSQQIQLAFDEKKEKTIYQEKITLFNLKQPMVIKSHILDVYGFFQKLIAFFLNIYPNGLFSFYEKIQTNENTVNRELLDSKLQDINDNSYIKFMVAKKSIFDFESKEFFDFQGHSMLIKKTEDGYSFFDPDCGEFPNLNIEELCDKIDDAMAKYKATDMAFLDAKEFLNQLENSNSLSDNSFNSII